MAVNAASLILQHQVPLETERSTPLADPRRISKALQMNVPKILPMLFNLFCLRAHGCSKAIKEACLDDTDIESNSESVIAPKTPNERKVRHLLLPDRIFLVKNTRPETVFAYRHQTAVARLLSWIKHSVLGVPRKVPLPL